MKTTKCDDRVKFEELFYSSRSIAELAVKLGYQLSNGNLSCILYRIVHHYIKLYGLPLSSIKGRSWSKGMTRESKNELPWDIVFCEDCQHRVKGSVLLKRLVRTNKRKNECEQCGLTEWCGKKIVLQIHHINGIRNDNRETNLQILCPNCHSQTDNWAGKNVKIKKEKNVLRTKKSLWNPIYRPNGPKPHKRKVERPTKNELENMLETMSYCAVGRKYGVSDNAIRKWQKLYNKWDAPAQLHLSFEEPEVNEI